MNVSSGAAKVFKCAFFSFLFSCQTNSKHVTEYVSWFVNLSTTAGFFTWWSINLTYIQFCTPFFYLKRKFAAFVLNSYRAWSQSTRPRSYPARLLESAAAGSGRMGCLLDIDLHPRQWLPGLFRVEHAGLPHGVHQHPHLLFPLDRLVSLHAQALLACRRNGLCYCASRWERFFFFWYDAYLTH